MVHRLSKIDRFRSPHGMFDPTMKSKKTKKVEKEKRKRKKVKPQRCWLRF